MNAFAVITLVGMIQGLFAGGALFSVQRHRNQAGRFLAVLLALVGASVAPILISNAAVPPAVSRLFKVVPDVRFLFGPFLWFYAGALAGGGAYRVRGKQLLHFLPYYLAGVVSVYVRFRSFPAWLVLNQFLVFFCYTHVLAYAAAVAVLLRRRAVAPDGRLSSAKKGDRRWLAFLAAVFIAVFVFMSVLEALRAAGIRGGVVDARYELTAAVVTLFVFGVGFVGLRRPDVLAGPAAAEKPKYGGSRLSPGRCAAYHARLVAYMEGEKPHLDCGLTIKRLAARCRIPDYHLTRVINEKAGMIYRDFVNSYRIAEARRMLGDPARDRLTIVGLAFESGFNSASAFYSAFRKFAGMTPLAFKRSLRPAK